MDDRRLVKLVGEIIGSERIEDDCAVLPFGEICLVVSTDMLHETTDFPEGMTDWQAGWMSVAVTLSDLASTGAEPRYLLLAVGLDDADRLSGIMQGARDCCVKYGAELVGGDVDSHSELTIVSTGIGSAAPENIVRRKGSVPGDLICITGTPGCAEAGLSGYAEHREALLEPKPHVREGVLLGRAGVSAMMDVSDGLVISLYDLMDVNDCGFSIESEKIPLPEGVPADLAHSMALYGGGDFYLLFTCSPSQYPVSGVDAVVIGEVTAESGVLVDGVPVEKRGYLHTWE